MKAVSMPEKNADRSNITRMTVTIDHIIPLL